MGFRYQTAETEKYEAIRLNRTVIVKDKKLRKYYISALSDTNLTEDLWTYKETDCGWRYVGFSIVLLLVCWGFSDLESNRQIAYHSRSTLSYGVFAWMVPLTLVQVALHEASHAVLLGVFGRKYDRFGFKLDYGFLPSVYVRINEVVMLPPPQRVIVHLAGVVINAIALALTTLLNITLIKSNNLALAILIYSIGLGINTLPLMNSDGYKALLTVLGIMEVKHWKSNGKLVRTSRAISVVLMVGYLAEIARVILMKIFM